jgi:Ca2+-transporting ATPase
MSTPTQDLLALGLTTAEARRRLQESGPNELPASRAEPLWRKVFRALSDPLVLVLLGAEVLTVVTADLTDSLVIGLVVVVNTVVAVRQEVGADRALAALRSMADPAVRVRRDGELRTCPARELVPGDVVALGQGDLVPADGDVLESAAFRVDEATLTGESVPVDKSESSDPQVLSGTAVVHGRALVLVRRTGAASALGQIAALLQSKHVVTPLQRRMARLSVQLAAAAIALCAVVFLVGWAQGQRLELMLLAAVSLAVAAVPESLPAVVTISLSLAARRMAHRNAVVRDLAAVETLGSVTLLATDKTGTLTQARMEVVDWWTPKGVDRATLHRAVRLCNDASTDGSGQASGDPTEVALLAATTAAEDSVAAYPRVGEVPFDSDRKRMSTMHRRPDGGLLLASKGAPELMLRAELLAEPESLLAAATARATELAAAGYRVLAVAQRELADSSLTGEVERDMQLLGLVALHDPPRPSAWATLAACHDAGLRVALVTGDHASTAAGLAERVGLAAGSPRVLDLSEGPLGLAADLDVDVIARARPSDKVEAIRTWQRQGQVVAMTGDGVNDGPALHRADIGVAMGRRGSEVARQAADIVLRDDELGTLVAAIEEGRRVYANIRRFLLYGLSGGVAEILVMLGGPIVGVPLPLLPAQILWVNLVTHSLTGTALGSEPAEPDAMSRPPRDPAEGILGAGLTWRLAVLAVVVALCGAVAAAAGPDREAQSVLMLSLSTAMLGVALGSRVVSSRGSRPGRPWRPANPVLFVAVAASAALLVAAVSLRPLQELLQTTRPGPLGFGSALAAAAVSFGATRWVTRVGRSRAEGP